MDGIDRVIYVGLIPYSLGKPHTQKKKPFMPKGLQRKQKRIFVESVVLNLLKRKSFLQYLEAMESSLVRQFTKGL